MFAVFAFGQPYFADYPIVGTPTPPIPPVTLEEELKGGGRRIYDPDDERTRYEPLSRRERDALFPPAPRVIAKASPQASPAPRPSPVTAPAPAEPDGLDPALVAAIMAFEDDLI